jgi:hypothetical protein
MKRSNGRCRKSGRHSAHSPEGKKLGSREAWKLAGLTVFEPSGFQAFRLPSLIAFQPPAVSYLPDTLFYLKGKTSDADVEKI